MKACFISVTGLRLRVLLGLPEDTRVIHVHPSSMRHDTYLVHVEGIGHDAIPGGVLHEVKGDVMLDTEGGLTWQIR